MKHSEIQEVKDKIEKMTPIERIEVLEDYCSRCGYKKERGLYCCSEGEDE